MVDLERHARHVSLPNVGVQGQQKLSFSRVLIIGAGGLGSPVALYLAAAGIGHIGIIDNDDVDLSNLQRQILHSTQSVGDAKVTSAQRRLNELDPNIKVTVLNARLNPANVLDVFSMGWDLIVDGTDNIPTRYLVDDACSLLNIPWVYGSIYQFEGQVTVFGHDDGPMYRDLFPEAPPAGAVPSCAEAGVFGVLPGVIGMLQATEAIKLLLGFEVSLSGTLLIYDALAMSFTELKFKKDESRSPVNDLSASSSLFHQDEWCALPKKGVADGEVEKPAASDDNIMFHHISMVETLHRKQEGWAPFVLDVRSDGEYAQMHVASCNLQIPHGEVLSVLNELPSSGDILLHCKSGMRSQMAAMTLIQAGIEASRLYNLDGGIMAWHAAAPSEIVH